MDKLDLGDYVDPNPEIYRATSKLRKQPMHIVMSEGGLGDFIARAPAIQYLVERHPHIELTVWAPSYMVRLFGYWFNGHERIKVIDRALFHKTYNRGEPVRDQTCALHTTLATHLTDHAFNIICDEQVEDEYKTYLSLKTGITDVSKYGLPDKYVVVTTGATAKSRTLPTSTLNGIIDFVMKKGYTPVFLGKKQLEKSYVTKFDEGANYDLGVNLIDKTNIMEGAEILGGAKAVVGLDNGLLHLACCFTDVPVVFGFSTVKPEHRVPYNREYVHIVAPSLTLNCRFCQSRMRGMFNHDFRTCIYDDYKCLELLTADKFIEPLKEIL